MGALIKTSWEIKEWVEESIPRDYLDWSEIHYDRFGEEYDEVHRKEGVKWIDLNTLLKQISDWEEIVENHDLNEWRKLGHLKALSNMKKFLEGEDVNQPSK